jgi:hypothetical protein
VSTHPSLSEIPAIRKIAHRAHNTAGGWVLKSKPMSTNVTASNQGNDGTARVRPKYIFLGIDANGSHHVAHTPSETVRIVHPDGSRATKDLTDPACPVNGIDAYVDYIAELGGWADQRYGRDLFAEFLAPYAEADE